MACGFEHAVYRIGDVIIEVVQQYRFRFHLIAIYLSGPCCTDVDMPISARNASTMNGFSTLEAQVTC